MKNSLRATLMFTAMSWPVWTYAQPASDAMAKTVKPDEMKWEPLGGRFRNFDALHESNNSGDVSCDTRGGTCAKALALIQ
jgi:hypothetical protein